MSTSRTRWSPAAVAVFEAFFRPWMRGRLAGVHLAGQPPKLPGDRAVVMVANHVGWWDAFVLRELQRSLAPRAPLLTLMRESELSRFPFFRWMGVVGIGESPGSLRRALREVQAITEEPPWLSIFPQGRLWPSWRRPLGFRRGVEAFARALAPAVVMPVGIHYEVLREPKPHVFAYAGELAYVGPNETVSAEELERRVAGALKRIYNHLAAFGEEAPRNWPSLEQLSPSEQRNYRINEANHAA